MLLTQKELRKTLSYGPKAGDFTWRQNMGSRAREGKIAGCITSQGYRIIKVKGKLYGAARLAHLYMQGRFPQNDVEHRNGDKADDRWENLRIVPRSFYIRNRSVKIDLEVSYS